MGRTEGDGQRVTGRTPPLLWRDARQVDFAPSRRSILRRIGPAGKDRAEATGPRRGVSRRGGVWTAARARRGGPPRTAAERGRRRRTIGSSPRMGGTRWRQWFNSSYKWFTPAQGGTPWDGLTGEQGYCIWPRTERAKASDQPDRYRFRRTEMSRRARLRKLSVYSDAKWRDAGAVEWARNSFRRALGLRSNARRTCGLVIEPGPFCLSRQLSLGCRTSSRNPRLAINRSPRAQQVWNVFSNFFLEHPRKALRKSNCKMFSVPIY